MTTSTSADLISALAGIAPGSALAALREQRPDAMRHAQGSYEALFQPAELVGLSRHERFLTAAHVARLHASSGALAHFEALARAHEATHNEVRLQAMLRHAELLSLRPVDATPDDLQRLADAGFST